MIPARRLLLLVTGTIPLAFASLILPTLAFVWAGCLGFLFLTLCLDFVLVVRLPAPSLSRRPVSTLSLGRRFCVEIDLLNPGPYPLKGWIRDDAPTTFEGAGCIVPVWVKAGGSSVARYELRALVRGRHDFGLVFLRSLSPLGLLVVEKALGTGQEVRVFPDLERLQRHQLLARMIRFSEPGLKTLRFRGPGTDFESLRPYVYGDDHRRIDWKATAKHGKLICRQLEVERNHEILIAIDAGRLMGSQVEGMTKLDHAINAALALAGVSIENGDRVGVLLFSDQVKAFLGPAKARGQLRAVLEVLFDARADMAETNFARAFAYLGERQKKRTLVIVLSDVADRETSVGMISGVLQQAKRHLFLFATLRDPFLRHTVLAQPQGAEQAFLHAVVFDLERDRQEVLQALRTGGVHTLDLEPREVTAPLISRYLEIRGRNLV